MARWTSTLAGPEKIVVSRAGYDIKGSFFSISVIAAAAYGPNCVLQTGTLRKLTPMVKSEYVPILWHCAILLITA